MIELAYPGYHPLNSHAEPRVGHAPVFSEIEIPLERFDWQLVPLEPAHEEIEVVDALASSDDLAITFGSQDIDA